MADTSIKEQLGNPEKRKYGTVKDFQNRLAKEIGGEPEIKVFKELSDEYFKEVLDRADIYREDFEGKELIIEIDATRADQVAKKMMSRFCYACLSGKPVVYVSLLYKGTQKMNRDECLKYFRMGEEVLGRINKDSEYYGFIIDGSELSSYPDHLPGSPVHYYSADELMALDMECYRKYMRDHGIKSAESEECYMRPVNKIYEYKDSLEIRRRLRDKVGNEREKDLFAICKHIIYECDKPKKDKDLSKNPQSYWQKYLNYLQFTKRREDDPVESAKQ